MEQALVTRGGKLTDFRTQGRRDLVIYLDVEARLCSSERDLALVDEVFPELLKTGLRIRLPGLVGGSESHGHIALDMRNRTGSDAVLNRVPGIRLHRLPVDGWRANEVCLPQGGDSHVLLEFLQRVVIHPIEDLHEVQRKARGLSVKRIIEFFVSN